MDDYHFLTIKFLSSFIVIVFWFLGVLLLEDKGCIYILLDPASILKVPVFRLTKLF